MVDEQWNVLATFAQRRNRHAEDVEPEEQIRPEESLLNQDRQILVRGRDAADVNGAGRLRADRADLPLLQHAQKLALQDRRKVADLVEKNRSLWASTNSPRWAVAAPVNAPRACPNSSLSSSSSGSAAQLTATNERSARGPLVWMARPTSSFPVPVSPVISTDSAHLGDLSDRPPATPTSTS